MQMVNDNERDSNVPESESDQLDSVFTALANERRRVVIRILRKNDACTVSDLAEAIAQIESNAGNGRTNSEDRKAAYVALIQTHLPRMDDLNVIDYAEDRKVVRRGKRYDEMNRALSAVEGGKSRWSRISDRF